MKLNPAQTRFLYEKWLSFQPALRTDSNMFLDFHLCNERIEDESSLLWTQSRKLQGRHVRKWVEGRESQRFRGKDRKRT
eukprot:5956039-Pleurochrysis_carterae.AAC.1